MTDKKEEKPQQKPNPSQSAQTTPKKPQPANRNSEIGKVIRDKDI